jgi:hypothetical protein
MPESTDTIKGMLIQDVPVKLVTNLLQKTPGLLNEAHGRAFEDKGWGEHEGLYALGYFRFILFQAMFGGEALKLKLEATVEYNKAKNTPYTLVRCGRFLFTGSHTQSQNDIPPTAWFREQHAAVNKGLINPFFPGFDDSKLNQADDIYGIFCYGAAVDDAKALGHMRLIFPSADGKKIVENIDLRELHLAMLEHARAVAQHEVAIDIAHPRLKKKINK